MHILVCDDDAAFSAKVAEYAATYFEAQRSRCRLRSVPTRSRC